MARIGKVASFAALVALWTLLGTAAALAGGGGHCDVTQARTAGNIDIEGACFLPTIRHADPGESITFVNRDSFPHNISGTGWGHYDDLEQGDRYQMSFADPGMYAFSCTLHPGMNGIIVVGDHVREPPADTAASISTTEPATGTGWVTAGGIGLAIGIGVALTFEGVRRRRARAS